jgi:hypothetical protein
MLVLSSTRHLRQVLPNRDAPQAKRTPKIGMGVGATDGSDHNNKA